MRILADYIPRYASRIRSSLVEQRVAEAMHFANRAYVLETGTVVLEGATVTLGSTWAGSALC